MGKLFTVRKPKLRLTKRGGRITRPSARIGGTFGVNISSRGVHASVHRPRRSRSGCGLTTLLLLLTASLFGFLSLLFASAAIQDTTGDCAYLRTYRGTEMDKYYYLSE